MNESSGKLLFAIMFGVSLTMIDLLLFPTNDCVQSAIVGAICGIFGSVVAREIFRK